jgi:hypothetical protein
MASRALNGFGTETLAATRRRRVDARADRVSVSSGHGSHAAAMQDATTFTTGSTRVSSAEGLHVAKGLLMAICLQVAATLCIYGLWQVWHLLR